MNVNQECHPLFGHSFLPLTKTRRLILVGTPKVRFLHQWYTPVYSVHTKASSVHFLFYGTIGDPFFQV